MAFVGAVISSGLSSCENYYFNWKGIDQKVMGSEKLGLVAFKWLNEEKNLSCTNIIVNGETLLKSVSAVKF